MRPVVIKATVVGGALVASIFVGNALLGMLFLKSVDVIQVDVIVSNCSLEKRYTHTSKTGAVFLLLQFLLDRNFSSFVVSLRRYNLEIFFCSVVGPAAGAALLSP